MTRQIDNLRPQPPSVLALGFRPFFLLAGVWAVLALPLWLAVLWGLLPPPGGIAGVTWHAHSLLFGYTMAVVAGFLLTAVRNWTNMQTPTGWWLAGLAALWVAGRALPFAAAPAWLMAAVDTAFPLALALSLWRPLWIGPNRVNRVFLPLLAGMAVAALMVHLDGLGDLPGLARAGDSLMLGLVIGTLLLVVGRVLPFFARSAVAGFLPVSRGWVETLTFALWGLWLPLEVLGLDPVAGVAALLLSVVLGLRLLGWHARGVWSIPILAVLYAGYLWLIFGLALLGIARLGFLQPFPALHALTLGAIGGFTLGMMSRVTLGHTGRAMRAPFGMIIAFGSLNLAAALRVFGPLVRPESYGDWLLWSGALWTFAFATFLWIHGPMLWSPRVDGRPG